MSEPERTQHEIARPAILCDASRVKNRNASELTVCGQKTVDQLVAANSDRIIRLFFSKDLSARYWAVCKKLAANRRIYRVVEPAELEKISGSIHHGGVAAVIPLPELAEPGPLEIAAWCAGRSRLVVLDNVANSHNLGSMVRTAAFLGIRDILISGIAERDDHLITGSMYRTAEGGMEFVRLWHVTNLVEFMDRYGIGNPQTSIANSLGRGIAFVAADHRAKLDLKQVSGQLSEKLGSSISTSAIAVVMGNEETGVEAEVSKRCILSARISGGGELDSLNVAQAAAIFMYALN